MSILKKKIKCQTTNTFTDTENEKFKKIKIMKKGVWRGKKLLQDEDDEQIEEMIEDVSSSQSLSLNGQWSQETKKGEKFQWLP